MANRKNNLHDMILNALKRQEPEKDVPVQIVKKAETAERGTLTLLDHQLIGLIELMDRRIATLEGEFWLLSSKLGAAGEAGGDS